MKPTFLGIGVPRGGSSWLHELVGAHPDAYASAAKELRFFDQNFANGWAWYERHFPPDAERDRWLAVGESTPFYLYDPQALERIVAVPEIERFLVVLRDPVERMFSHYVRAAQHDAEQGTFAAFVESTPDAVRWSRYAEPLARWLDAVGAERLLVLEHDEATGDPATTRELVARHLGLDPERFPQDAGVARVNASFAPRFPGVYRVAARTAEELRRRKLGWISRVAVRRLGAKHWFGTKDDARPVLLATDRMRFLPRFEDDIDRLEQLLGRSFAPWRDAAPRG